MASRTARPPGPQRQYRETLVPTSAAQTSPAWKPTRTSARWNRLISRQQAEPARHRVRDRARSRCRAWSIVDAPSLILSCAGAIADAAVSPGTAGRRAPTGTFQRLVRKPGRACPPAPSTGRGWRRPARSPHPVIPPPDDGDVDGAAVGRGRAGSLRRRGGAEGGGVHGVRYPFSARASSVSEVVGVENGVDDPAGLDHHRVISSTIAASRRGRRREPSCPCRAFRQFVSPPCLSGSL